MLGEQAQYHFLATGVVSLTGGYITAPSGGFFVRIQEMFLFEGPLCQTISHRDMFGTLVKDHPNPHSGSDLKYARFGLQSVFSRSGKPRYEAGSGRSSIRAHMSHGLL